MAQIEVFGIEQRAIERLVQEQGRAQKNMEDITARSMKHITDDAKPEDIDDDWIVNFFAKARNISNADMQVLWSKILAGEANKPNSFSPRTIEFLPGITKNDADLFTKFCSFCWMVGDRISPIVFNPRQEVIVQNGIGFEDLNHLDDIGMISFSPVSFTLDFSPVKPTEKVKIFYYGRSAVVPVQNGKLDIGKCLLTSIGRELAPISGSTASEKYFQSVIGFYREKTGSNSSERRPI